MSVGEYTKAITALCGAVVSAVPQILSTYGGVIPQNVATWMTISAGVATFILVYLLPNLPGGKPAEVPAQLPPVDAPSLDEVRDAAVDAYTRATELAREAEARLRDLGR